MKKHPQRYYVVFQTDFEYLSINLHSTHKSDKNIPLKASLRVSSSTFQSHSKCENALTVKNMKL